MKKLFMAMILAITTLLLAGCLEELASDESIAAIGVHYNDGLSVHGGLAQLTQPLGIQRLDVEEDEESDASIRAQSIKIGVTHPGNDNVGQILNFFGSGVDFYELTHADLRSPERLNEFFAIFINCGSHDAQPRVLRTYVEQGGIVYASDHAGGPLTVAFPDVFQYEVVVPSLTVRSANIPHASLASHMDIDNLDVIFNLGSWYVISELSEDATVYIEGYVPSHGHVPLAVSFEYGDGTVFFTSFHNNAQATSHMIDFIEYLVFRIKFIEADRTQSLRAASEGFEFQGQVFGFFARSSAPAGNIVIADAEAAPAAMAAERSQDAFQQTFQYNFLEGEGFMLMVEAGGESFILRLRDPLGNIYYISEHGKLISRELVSSGPTALQHVFESIEDEYGVKVRNTIGGEWRFTIIADDAPADAVFAVGIATQAP